MSRTRCLSARQRGFGAVLAVLVVVMLAVLAASLVRLSWSSQSMAAGANLSARARQAARAGTEWGLYQALQAGSCAASTNIDLSAATGMRVAVACSYTDYTEGVQDDGSTPRTVRVYTIVAVGCNSATACPDSTQSAQPGYVEREARVSATSAYTQP